MKIYDEDIFSPTSKGKAELDGDPEQVGCQIVQSIEDGHNSLPLMTKFWSGKDLAPRSLVYRDNPKKYIRDYLSWLTTKGWIIRETPISSS